MRINTSLDGTIKRGTGIKTGHAAASADGCPGRHELVLDASGIIFGAASGSMIQIKLSPKAASMLGAWSWDEVGSVRSTGSTGRARASAAPSRPRYVRWLIVLLALVISSASPHHTGNHAAANAAVDITAVAAADVGPDDCDRDHEHAQGESCAALTVCKHCVPLLDSVPPDRGASARHSWISDTFTPLISSPLHKPPRSTRLA